MLTKILGSDEARHTVWCFLTGYTSSRDVSDAWILTVLNWLRPYQDAYGWQILDVTGQEVWNLYHAGVARLGQLSLIVIESQALLDL